MILIIDFGSQYNQLIARRVREHEVYCQIDPPQDINIENLKKMDLEGIILSGGPSSIYEENSPKIDSEIFNLGIPVLGICYGMQFMVNALGGNVERAEKREYGLAELSVSYGVLFDGIDKKIKTWMSHGDSITKIPSNFSIVASTENTKYAAIEDNNKKHYGLQFHPEVEHTEKGRDMLANFLFKVCNCKKSWTMKSFAQDSIEQIKEQVGDKKVILGLSGGVDSSVAALLIHKAIGKNLTCIFVDNGLLRKNEGENLKKTLSQHLDMNIIFVDAVNDFLKPLAGVTDPEKKRKIIGNVFMEVFDREAAKIADAEFLAQGTLYPDIIESKSAFGGPTSVIKSHHNVGGLPEDMKLKLVEPLKYLFKDEVRKLGEEIGLPDELVWRQPFPGPGLGIRIMGEITKKKLEVLREADALLLKEVKEAGLYKSLWQSFAVLLPIKSVGVMGDLRTYENTIVIRAVTSKDAMTADWAKLPHEFLGKVSNAIINQVDGVNRVVYDITSKPPGTIEWE